MTENTVLTTDLASTSTPPNADSNKNTTKQYVSPTPAHQPVETTDPLQISSFSTQSGGHLRSSSSSFSTQAQKLQTKQLKNKKDVQSGSSRQGMISSQLLNDRYTEELSYVAPLPAITLEDRTGDIDTVTVPGSHVYNISDCSDISNGSFDSRNSQNDQPATKNQRSNGTNSNGHLLAGNKNKHQVWAKDVHVGNYTIIQGNTGTASKIGAYVVWTIEIEVMGPEKRTSTASDEPNNEATVPPNDHPSQSGTALLETDSDSHSSLQPSAQPSSFHHYNSVPQYSFCGNPTAAIIVIHKRYSDIYRLRQQIWYAFPSLRHSIPDLPPKSIVSRFREKFLESRRKGLEFFLLNILLNPVFADCVFVKEFVRKR